MKDNPEQEAQWIAAMVELEDERGTIVPAGAQGGVVARDRRARAEAQRHLDHPPPVPVAAAVVAYPNRDTLRGYFLPKAA